MPTEFWALETASADAENWSATAEELAGVGHWRITVAPRASRWSPGMFRLFGLPVSDKPDIDLIRRLIHPEDLARSDSDYERAQKDGRDYSIRARVRQPDGSFRSLRGQVVCRKDETGKVTDLMGAFVDVTEANLAREMFERARADYLLIAENTTEIIATTTLDGTITYISPACARVLGREPDEMLGRRCLEITHPADISGAVRVVSQLVAAGTQAPRIDLQYRARHKDGRWIWLEGRPRIVFDKETGEPRGIQDVLRDVTVRKETEEKLKQSEALYRLLTEKSQDIIVRTDLSAKILYASPSCRAMGYEPEDLVGRDGTEFLHPDDLASFNANSEALAAGTVSEEARTREHRFRTKSGDYVWLQGNPVALADADGKPVEIVNFFRDVTRRRVLDDALEEARRAAEEHAAAKSDFLANMSHEIRTPLTSIIGFSQLVAEQPELTAKTRDFAGRVQHASQSLLELVNDILDFSKLESGQVEIRRAPASPLGILKEVVSLFTLKAQEKSLKLTQTLEGDLSKYLLIDESRIRQVLVNLVGNAVKFTEAGSISIAAAFDGKALRFEIADTGPGIPEARHDLLFARFSQLDATSRRAAGGTGLGLAICKGLTDAMGGSIGVESKEGEGSRFWFEIPATQAADSKTPPPISGGGRGAGRRLEQIRILAADDNASNRKLLEAVLETTGAELTLAQSGAEAIERAGQAPFDILLLDLHMPEIDGPEAARTIRGTAGPNRTTPMLAFTADVMADKKTTAIFDGIVLKPVSPSALVKAIADCLVAAQPSIKAG